MAPGNLLARLRVVAFVLFAAALTAGANECRAIDLSGHWSGTWASGNTRHHGPLQAEFVRLNDREDEVFFKGKSFDILPVRHNAGVTAR